MENQPKPFLILFNGGEGSSFFSDVLASIFWVYIPSFEPLDNHQEHTKGMSIKNKLEWLKQLYRLPLEEQYHDAWQQDITQINPRIPMRIIKKKILRVRSVGIKMRMDTFYPTISPLFTATQMLLPNDGPPDGHKQLLQLLKDRNVALVCFRRKNLIKRSVSVYRMTYEQKSQFSGDTAPSKINPFLLYLLTKVYECRLKKLDSLVHQANIMEIPCLEIYYEEILQNRNSPFQKFFDFLNIDSTRINLEKAFQGAAFKKCTDDDLKKSVKNFDSIYRFFKNTKYSGYFE